MDIKGNPVKINGTDINTTYSKKPVYIYSNPLFTTSTTYSYTGVSISIPAKSFYTIYVKAVYQNSKPYEIALSRSSTVPGGGEELASALTGHHNASVSYSDYTSVAMTIYVWARYSGANTNQLRIKGFYIPE